MPNTTGAVKTPIESGLVSRIANGWRGMIRGVTGADWFGPQQPLRPVAPEGTQPRLLDYPFGVNLQIQPRTLQGGTSFAQMRALADGYDLLRLVIETRKDQVCKMPWSFRLKRQPGETNATVRERTAKHSQIGALTDMFRRPDGEHSFKTWIREALEDVFVIDALSILPRRNMAGDVIRLDLIDGATINRLIDTEARTPLPPSPAYQQIIKGLPAVDLVAAGHRRLWDPDTRPDELLYCPRNVRSSKIYGYSPVEQIIVIVNLAIRRQLSKLAYYTDGNIPEAIAQVPDSWSTDQIERFQLMWDAMSGDLEARRRIRFVPNLGGQAGLTFTKDAVLKDELDEWLARVVCYCFSVSPQPFVKEMNRATAQQASESALTEGLVPILDWFAEIINYAVEFVLEVADIQFAWNIEQQADGEKQARIDDTNIRNGSKSIDEVRESRGEDPIGMGPAVFTATGPVLLSQFTAVEDQVAEKLAKADKPGKKKRIAY